MQEVGCCLELGNGCSQVASAGANENICCRNYRGSVKIDGKPWEVGGEFEGRY